jgi:integrase/recombinase XerC/integrase/recombinase XerD
MQHKTLYFPKKAIQKANRDTIFVTELRRSIDDWLYDAEYRQQSKNTIDGKRLVCDKLLWFLEQQRHETCGLSELRQFMAYVRNGHRSPGGRWGNPRNTKEASPRTTRYYYIYLQGLFKWLVKEDVIQASPMERIDKPQEARRDQIVPFTPDQVTALILAARQSPHPERDEAIIRFLLDTGVRSTELCTLYVGDVDMLNRRAEVMGKGRKRRVVYFGRNTAKALREYLKITTPEPDQCLFLSEGGSRRGVGIYRRGLQNLITRTGQRAGLQAVRCSPHTFRHTFAVEFIRNGGNTFTLQEILGHTDLKMTMRYVALAQADIEKQHQRFSPGDKIIM